MSATITTARVSMMTRAPRPALCARRESAASPLIRAANAKIAFPRTSSRSPPTSTKRRAVAARASSDSEVSAPILAVAAAGIPSSLIVLWSSYTKATTGAGLQGDLLGGLEGVSYLVSVAGVRRGRSCSSFFFPFGNEEKKTHISFPPSVFF